jgi:hypothetical protein
MPLIVSYCRFSRDYYVDKLLFCAVIAFGGVHYRRPLSNIDLLIRVHAKINAKNFWPIAEIPVTTLKHCNSL